MTKKVLLAISGLHIMDMAGDEPEESEPIEVITPASYYLKNGKHYILYDEVIEGSSQITKNKIKITGNEALEIIKSGATSSHMIFEKNRMNATRYETPYGEIQVGVFTKSMNVEESEDFIGVEVEYGLDVNSEPVADCHISLSVRPGNARVL